MNIQEERRVFEGYFKTVWEGIDLIQTIGEDDAFKQHQEKYVEEIIQSHWETWLASRNREGYALVPMEPTFHMIHEGQVVLFHGGDSAYIYRSMIKEASK